MKTRIIVSALLVMLLSAGINSKTDAAPWRHGGYWFPHPVVRVVAPRLAVCVPPVVVGGGYYSGYYPRPAYYGGYYAPRPAYYGGYYAPRPAYYGGHYAPAYYGHGGYGGYHGYAHGYGHRR